MKYIIIALLFSCSAYCQWEQISTTGANALIIHKNTLIAGQLIGVRRSIDNGNTWVPVDDGLETDIFKVGLQSMLSYHDYIIGGGTFSGGVFRSIDTGSHWINLLASNTIYSSANSNSHIIAVLGNNMLYRSEDSAITWKQDMSGYGHLLGDNSHDLSATATTYNGTSFFAGNKYGEIYRSQDNGHTWESVFYDVSYPYVTSLTSNASATFARIGSAIFRTTDNGNSWHIVNESFSARTMYGKGNSIVLGGQSGGVVFSSDDGSSWIDISTGLTNTSPIVSIVANEEYLFISTSQSIWRRPLSQLHTINDTKETLLSTPYPYPNPASNETHVSVSLAESGYISTTIYDLLGREIEKTASTWMEKGEHSITLNTSNWASGSYYIRLSTPSGEIKTVKVIKE